MAASGDSGLRGIEKETVEQISKKFEPLLCDVCKAKILEKVRRLSVLDKLLPHKTARKFSDAVCKQCREKIIKQLRK